MRNCFGCGGDALGTRLGQMRKSLHRIRPSKKPRSILDEGFTKIKKNKSQDSVSHVPNKETVLETEVFMTNIVFALKFRILGNLHQSASHSLAKCPLVTSCDPGEGVQACLHMFGLMSRCPVSSCISRSTHAGIFFTSNTQHLSRDIWNV